MRTLVIAVALLVTATVCGAAERQWQTGVWRDSDIKRQILDFGPGASGFGPPRNPAPMRAMADVRIYVIETDDLRLEIKDVVPIGRRSVDVTIGQSVTFALQKNTVWVRDEDGIEHKLRLTKKTVKRPR